jgi:parvulin-like peptidyl-prolyl isomerase
MSESPKPIPLLAAALAFSALATSAPAAEDLNRIVLRVNDEIVTLHDYESRKSVEIARILSQPDLGAGDRQELLSRVGREVMQNLFSELLLLSFADQHGIRVSDREVAQALEDMQASRGIETREQLEEALAASGMTYDELEANARRDMLWSQVIGQEVNAKIELGEEEVRAYYRNNPQEFELPEQRWLKEIIVLESSGLPDDELEDLAAEIHRALAAGGDLESVAESYGEQETTTGVIDLGWLTEEEIGESLAEAAWSLEPGRYSPPVRARGGYHILYLAELREARMRPFSEVEDLVERRMRGQRFNKELRGFMARLEQQAYIRENLPPEAVGYRALAGDFELEDELEVFRSPVVAGKGGEEGEERD